MKHHFEKNLKIINELMTYLHKLKATDINVNMKRFDTNTHFHIWGNISGIDSDELEKLNEILNTNRQHEVEEYYWNLGGEGEADGELSLIGMMIDSVEISYSNNILTFDINRNDF